MRLLNGRAVAFAGLLFAVLFGFGAASAPQPEPVPTRWEFDLAPGAMRIAELTAPDGSRQSYFYLTYRVINYSGRDRIFAPSFLLAGDQGTPVRSGAPAWAVQEIQRRLGDPLLEDQLSIVDVLLQGFDNARFGVVLWPAGRMDVDEVRVFAAGFSGESTDYYTVDRESGRRVRHTLRKTRMLTYAVPGDIRGDRPSRPLELSGSQWVMR